ncbi:MAG: hypothetical protein IBV52_07420 [Candidatus Bathyarchaeota archaeon]
MSNSKSRLEEEDEALYNTNEKWYIRRKWLKYCEDRIAKSNRDHMKLLTLTCTKTYDIQLFLEHGLILKTEIGFDSNCLAFCEIDNHRFALIQNKLPGARYFNGSFENLVGAGRVNCASRKEIWFPFDVVNLDIKGCILSEKARVLDAISKLFIIQRLKGQSFTLFLTICSIEEGDFTEKIMDIQKFLNNNLKNRELFEKFFEKYPTGIIPEYYQFQAETIPKRIVEIGFFERFDVSCAEKLTYIGETNTTRMISLVFECEFQGDSDLTGLAELRNLRMIEMFDKECEDVNELLANDADILTVVDEMKQRFS